MKIVLPDGREIPAVNHRSATILHLMQLRQQSRDLYPGGLTVSALEQLSRSAIAHDKAIRAGKEPPDGSGGEAEIFFSVVLFLSRRAAGDAVTFSQAIDIPVDGVQVILEDGDTQPKDLDAVDPHRSAPGFPETPGAAAAGQTV